MVAMYNNSSNYTEDGNGNYTSSGTSVAVRTVSNFKLNTDNIGKANEDVLNFDLDMNVEKVVSVTTSGNWMTDDDPQVSYTPVPEMEYPNYFETVKITCELKSVDTNKLSLICNVAPDKITETLNSFEISATIYLNDILNFPTTLPTEITEYITAE